MENKFSAVIVDYNSIVTLFPFVNSCTETNKPQLAIKQLVTGQQLNGGQDFGILGNTTIDVKS